MMSVFSKAFLAALALSFSLTAVPASAQQLEFDFDMSSDSLISPEQAEKEIQELAELYFIKRWSHMPHQHESFMKHLETNVLSNKDFQKDAVRFYQNLRRERGAHQNLSLPGDAILGLLKILYDYNGLQSYADKAKAAGY